MLGCVAAVKLLVEKTGGSRECLEVRDARNRTPLIVATIHGHGELVNCLLSLDGLSLRASLTTDDSLSQTSLSLSCTEPAEIIICLECGANDLHMVQLMPLPPHHLLLH